MKKPVDIIDLTILRLGMGSPCLRRRIVESMAAAKPKA